MWTDTLSPLGLLLIVAVSVLIIVVIGIQVNNYFIYVDEVKYQASLYNPTLKGYDKPNPEARLYIIENTNDCDGLKELFERNQHWWVLPKLADKIIMMRCI